MKIPHRVQIYEWKTGKVLPKPTSLKSVQDNSLKEELALIAIKRYLPYVQTQKKLLEVWREIKTKDKDDN